MIDDLPIINLDETPAAGDPEPEKFGRVAIDRDFILGGNAYFRVTAPSGRQITYRVTARDGKKGSRYEGIKSYFVNAFNVTELRYEYVGILDVDAAELVPSKQSQHLAGTPEFDVAAWALRTILENVPIAEGYRVEHADRCGKCGKHLVTIGDRQSGFHLDCTEPNNEAVPGLDVLPGL